VFFGVYSIEYLTSPRNTSFVSRFMAIPVSISFNEWLSAAHGTACIRLLWLLFILGIMSRMAFTGHFQLGWTVRYGFLGPHMFISTCDLFFGNPLFISL